MEGPRAPVSPGAYGHSLASETDDGTSMRYYQVRTYENAKFWMRLGGMPYFKGRTVLEVGCGLGQLCMEMAISGASKVVGIDIDSRPIEFANRQLGEYYPELKDVVEFLAMDLKQYEPAERFDFAISYSTFEHVDDLEGMIAEIRRRLVPGGRLYFGFGPLYNSPFGDHGWTRAGFPWGHLIIPERFLVKKVNHVRKEKISSIGELGLNKWSYKQYDHLFRNCGLTMRWLKTNQCERLLPKLLSSFSHIPGLSEFFTFNMYGILEKPLRDDASTV